MYSENLPENERGKFQPVSIASSELFEDLIPKSLKPLVAPYHPSSEEIENNWKALKSSIEFDVASMALGGKIISTSNEHYGPSFQVISPFSPIHMFDGFESSRSRIKGNNEEIVIQLGKKSAIHRIVIDFTYFPNNNPAEMKILGLSQNQWITLVDKTKVKAFAANKKEFKIKCQNPKTPKVLRTSNN